MITSSGFERKENRIWFVKGMRYGVPIGAGYLAVSFALGIMIRKQVGFSALAAALTSALAVASAGEYAGFTVIAASAPYVEMVIAMLVINARYLLMSTALSQKFPEKMAFFHRFFVAHFVTDEIFGVASSDLIPEGKLNPFVIYGMGAVAVPCWAIGTGIGVLAGNILPADIAKALSVCLYGMFIAIIIPPAKRNKVIAAFIAIAFLCSYGASVLPYLSALSEGTRIIILTVALSLIAALLFPVKDEEDAASPEKEVTAK